MKPREVIKTGQSDMFRSRLDQIIDLGHEKAVLADRIDWKFVRYIWRGLYGPARSSAVADAADGGAADSQIRR